MAADGINVSDAVTMSAAGEDGATAATPCRSGCCRWSASATG